MFLRDDERPQLLWAGATLENDETSLLPLSDVKISYRGSRLLGKLAR